MAAKNGAKVDGNGKGKGKPARSAYDQFKEFEGKRYTGMKVGRRHKWRYDAGEWIEKAGEPLGVAAISFWEIAKLVEHAKIRLPRSVDRLFDEIEQHAQIALLPLSPRICLESTQLGPRFHRDPADRIIAAIARVHALRLVTADDRIERSGVVSTV